MTNELFWLRPWDEAEHEPIIRDVFKDWATGSGIFDQIMLLEDMPWADDPNATADVLDLEYFGNHSGAKYCSPVVKFLINDDGYVPDAGRVALAKIIVAKYLVPWSRLWLTNVVAYSPVNNYDMTESRNLLRNDSEGEISSETQSHTGTDTLQHGKTQTTTHGKTVTETVSKFGLNSGAVPPKADLVEDVEGGTTVVADTGSDVDTKNLQDSSLVNKNKAGAAEETETTHRIGNIGVTTNQKLINEERALWLWNYFEQVFKDIDKELTLAISDPCRV